MRILHAAAAAAAYLKPYPDSVPSIYGIFTNIDPFSTTPTDRQIWMVWDLGVLNPL